MLGSLARGQKNKEGSSAGVTAGMSQGELWGLDFIPMLRLPSCTFLLCRKSKVIVVAWLTNLYLGLVRYPSVGAGLIM